MSLETQANAVNFAPTLGVEVDKIEKELKAMWSGASDAAAGGGSGVTRACALNLIVYTTPEDDRDQLEDLLSEVNDGHPSRTLILIANREAQEPRLEAYVSMRCRLLSGSGKQICGEQVTIEAGGALVETAATAVAPLLVPDVPVYLWWKDIPHYNDKLFTRLARIADRIVIDSAAFDHPYVDLLRLNKTISDDARTVSVSDINWGRLTSWRNLLASFWDVADYRPLLDAIDHVAIEYRAPSAEPGAIAPQALLLVGWLASRLGWKVAGKYEKDQGSSQDIAGCILSAIGRPITLSLVRDNSGGQNDGMISSVALLANSREGYFSVARPVGSGKLETEARIGTEHSVLRVLAYETRSDAERVSLELTFLGRDAIYEEALAQAAQFLETIDQSLTA
jgi:glucose-6-phosphate dehydrogenase assembly protein OpcA